MVEVASEVPMFREIPGLPGHLVVHAAVEFVPLLALLAVGYAVLPAGAHASTGPWAGRLLWFVVPLVVTVILLLAVAAGHSGATAVWQGVL